jgi:hypothetical protein
VKRPSARPPGRSEADVSRKPAPFVQAALRWRLQWTPGAGTHRVPGARPGTRTRLLVPPPRNGSTRFGSGPAVTQRPAFSGPPMSGRHRGTTHRGHRWAHGGRGRPPVGALVASPFRYRSQSAGRRSSGPAVSAGGAARVEQSLDSPAVHLANGGSTGSRHGRRADNRDTRRSGARSPSAVCPRAGMGPIKCRRRTGTRSLTGPPPLRGRVPHLMPQMDLVPGPVGSRSPEQPALSDPSLTMISGTHPAVPDARPPTRLEVDTRFDLRVDAPGTPVVSHETTTRSGHLRPKIGATR